MALAANLGYPRIGGARELKRLTEAYWAGRLSAAELRAGAAGLRAEAWRTQRDAGLDHIPSNDFSFYDHVLDAAMLVGAVPPRFHAAAEGEADPELATCFAMARGLRGRGSELPALGLTKWFDTNYHYIVPEIGSTAELRLASTKPFDEFAEALALGVRTRPVLLGPISFLLLSRCAEHACAPLQRRLDAAVEVYAEVVARLAALGAEWIQLDEPCLVQDRTRPELAALEPTYQRLAAAAGSTRLLLQTYFGDVVDAYPVLMRLPVAGLGLDLVRGPRNLELLRRHGFPSDMVLSAGVVDGRGIWINDLDASLERLERLADTLGAERLIVAPSSSLLHVPVDASRETALDPELRGWLAFARQKLDETVLLARALNAGRQAIAPELEANRAVRAARAASGRTTDLDVRRRAAMLAAGDKGRRMAYAQRRQAQRARLGLPPLPVTTIGSFPQDAAVRRARRNFRAGELDAAGYQAFLRAQVARAVRVQEAAGVDVLTHGEFERADMVEYFAERLDGFAFTAQGWVQSYGTRCVKPPIVYGDVRRRGAMTVDWWRYAQSLTSRPVKGMLTGPVTMLQWSFVRDDQPRSATCMQLALALRDEVADLERAGAAVIQVDEPALREGLPPRRADWSEYLGWAVDAFRVVTGGVRPETQVHTHMCYSSFGDILEAIAGLDADVLLIESARSGAALLEVFRTRGYPRALGPGVWDIHSPRVPSTAELSARIRGALHVLGPDQLWITPDCGLKTRDWEQVEPALRNLGRAAHAEREALAAAILPPAPAADIGAAAVP